MLRGKVVVVVAPPPPGGGPSPRRAAPPLHIEKEETLRGRPHPKSTSVKSDTGLYVCVYCHIEAKDSIYQHPPTVQQVFHRDNNCPETTCQGSRQNSLLEGPDRSPGEYPERPGPLSILSRLEVDS